MGRRSEHALHFGEEVTMRPWAVLLFALAGCAIDPGLEKGDNHMDAGPGVAPCAPNPRCAPEGGSSFDGMAIYQIGPRMDIEHTACPSFAPDAGAVLYGDFGDTSFT